MPLTLTWSDVALRLALTVLASGLFGFNRGEQGHAAGLRTMLLVGLAAAVAMLQTNWLMDTAGKTPDSFVTLDLMRLPLGILSGIGFIGAGALGGAAVARSRGGCLYSPRRGSHWPARRGHPFRLAGLRPRRPGLTRAARPRAAASRSAPHPRDGSPRGSSLPPAR